MRRVVTSWLAVAVLVTAAASVSAQAGPFPVRLLDVPYVQQTEALCGGAAAAMVMRYWGATGIDAESFAPLLDPAARGIRADDLLRDLRARGWNARSFRGDRPLVAARLADGQPLVALIEDRPGYFHFVVIVAWANGRVIYHDPARAPFRVVGESVFEAAWEPSDRWTMLALPPAGGVKSAPEPARESRRPGSASPCSALVAQGVQAAGAGERTGALEMFSAAAGLCPSDPAPLREAAGVYALDENWAEAGRLAKGAVTRDPADEHAWRILATSAYVAGDPAAALAAWNGAGEPRIDLVTVQGLGRTRHAVASGILGLEVDAVLTTRALAAARRRLSDLPSADVARVNYRPLGGGRASVEAVVVERPTFPTSRGQLAATAVRMVSDRELAASVASITGGGELLSASWRWWENRPRVDAAYAAPSSFGIWRGEIFGEEQTYGDGAAAAVEARRGGGLTLSHWTPTLMRWQLGAGLDVWRDRGRTANITGSIDQRLRGDRLWLRAGGSLLGGAFTAWTAAVAADARSGTGHEAMVWLGRAGF
ncbi:MAG TPA: papain-like cysteine protease family protein, partial [Vicinamibacterales bacterium]|nr:papain-like cysteine protease family protein [Vicinamibacterales bacterium]